MITFTSNESEERSFVRSAVAQIAADFGHQAYLDAARRGEFPEGLWSPLAEAGFAGVNVSEDFGGAGGSLSDLAVVAEEVAAQGCPLMTLVVSPGMCVPIIQRYGNAEQRNAWLGGLGDGSIRMSFALTEPDAGTNTHALRSTAEKVDDGWVLRGEKYYISGLDHAEAFMTVVKTGTRDDGRAQLSIFVVDTNARGVVKSPIDMSVVAAERQFVLSFDDIHVPDDALIGTAGAGLAQLFEGLNPERVLSAATCVGLGRFALEKAVAYANERSVWKAPIGSHQAIAHPLARAYARLVSARNLLYSAAEAHDAGVNDGLLAAVAKYEASHAAEAALDAAIQTHGGNGLSHEYGLSEMWGIVRMYRIAPVSDEMVLNHLATNALGLPRSY